MPVFAIVSKAGTHQRTIQTTTFCIVQTRYFEAMKRITFPGTVPCKRRKALSRVKCIFADSGGPIQSLLFEIFLATSALDLFFPDT